MYSLDYRKIIGTPQNYRFGFEIYQLLLSKEKESEKAFAPSSYHGPGFPLHSDVLPLMPLSPHLHSSAIINLSLSRLRTNFWLSRPQTYPENYNCRFLLLWSKSHSTKLLLSLFQTNWAYLCLLHQLGFINLEWPIEK